MAKSVSFTGAEGGDVVMITMELDEEPREDEMAPPDLVAALDRNRAAAVAWEKLAPPHRREYVGAILEAKRPETRARRIERAVEMLAQGGER